MRAINFTFHMYKQTKRICFFISDHGYGHAARSVLIIQELLKRQHKLQIVTAVPMFFFEARLSSADVKRISFLHRKIDVGVYSLPSSFASDVDETRKQLQKFWSNKEEMIEQIASQVKHNELIVFDITCVAPLVAEKCNIPSIGVSNFCWDWIYQDPYFTNFDEIIQLQQEAYRKTTLFLRLPYGIPKNELAFPNIQDVDAWVAQQSQPDVATVRNWLKEFCPELTDNIKLMFFTFGGHAFPYTDLVLNSPMWKVPKNWRIVLSTKLLSANMTPSTPQYEGVIHFSDDQLSKVAKYSDLLAAADCVVCKTGYGTVSECMGLLDPSKQVILYTDRPGFREHELLVQALDDRFKCAQVTSEEVIHALPSLFAKAESLLATTKTDVKPVLLDGAQKVAEIVSHFHKI